MVEAGSKLACFVGADAYVAAGGTTRADLFGKEVYLEQPEILHRLVDEKLAGIRKKLEAEGWGWIEINPERDWQSITRCSRIKPMLVGAPNELIDLKSQIDVEIEELEQTLAEKESDDLLERQKDSFDRLEGVEQQLAAFVDFDAAQKKLAGCYVSIGEDGTPCYDKGLVKPEQRKQLARLLKTDDGDGEPEMVKPKNPLSASLRRDLASYRLQAAQVEIAKHPAIALDLLAFQAASQLLDARPVFDGPDILFKRSDVDPTGQKASTIAAKALQAMAKSLPANWRKAKSETARFEAFRSLPHADKLRWLGYSVALTLRPKLAPATIAEATAYDMALDLTGGDLSSYWRPAKDSFLSRVSRDQLLAIARDTLGEAWVKPRASDKKALLVDQLDRAFADPAKQSHTAEQAEKLKSWLPTGMALSIHLHSKPAKAKKAAKAA
jgi:ParB family chromosome partitioning protein